MEFERNKRSKRQPLPLSPFSRTQLQAQEPTTQRTPAWSEETWHHERDEKELEERMDKFYSLLERIKIMKELWQHGSENKGVKPVLEPVWQPTFSLEDFDGLDREVRERMDRKGNEEKRGEVHVPLKGNEETEEQECEKEHQKDSEEMKWHEVEDNNGIDLNLSL